MTINSANLPGMTSNGQMWIGRGSNLPPLASIPTGVPGLTVTPAPGSLIFSTGSAIGLDTVVASTTPTQLANNTQYFDVLAGFQIFNENPNPIVGETSIILEGSQWKIQLAGSSIAFLGANVVTSPGGQIISHALNGEGGLIMTCSATNGLGTNYWICYDLRGPFSVT